jgi:hypothetical protein
MIFFSFLTDFSYFTLNFFLWKLLDMIWTGQIWRVWKGV